MSGKQFWSLKFSVWMAPAILDPGWMGFGALILACICAVMAVRSR